MSLSNNIVALNNHFLTMAFQSYIPLTYKSSTSYPSHCISTKTSSTTILHHQRQRRCFINPVCCAATPTDSTESKSEESAATTNDDSSNLAPPPNTFFQAITQAQEAVNEALSRNETLLEVEFPPLPTNELESPAVGSYEVSNANARLAIDFAKRYAKEGKKVVISFPDRVERDRVLEDYEIEIDTFENVRLSCLKDSRPGLFIERIWTKPEIELALQDDDDMYIILAASCQELPDVEKLVLAVGNKPVILFNLKLDTSRGDLGLPAFPRKDLHYRFLSKVLPVYYLRTRTYSRTLTRPPYLVNYSGALFKVYPGRYQVLLDTSAGSYRRLHVLDERPPLGAVRDMLTDGMNLEGQDEKEAKDKSFLYRGYKSRTWWEDDRTKAESNKWRS